MQENPSEQALKTQLLEFTEAIERGEITDPEILERLHKATSRPSANPQTEDTSSIPSLSLRQRFSKRIGSLLSRRSSPEKKLRKGILPDISELPEGQECRDLLLKYRETIFPWTTKFINFENSGYNHRNAYAKEAQRESVEWEEDDDRAKLALSRARREAARLISADHDEIIDYKKGEEVKAIGSKEIAFIKDTTDGIICIAQNFNWQAGDKVVVLNSDYEFQSNINPWKALEKRGVEVIQIGQQDGLVHPEEIAEALKQNPRMIALSSNGWKTGQRVNLQKIGKMIQKYNASEEKKGKPKTRFCIDGIQSLGAAPIDVKACGIDYLAAGSSKWMTAGSTSGFLYISQDAIEDLDRDMYLRKNYDEITSPVQDTAKAFEGGKSLYMSASALGATATLLNRIGIENIHQRIIELSDYLVSKLTEIGFEITSPRENEEEKSGIVVFRHRSWLSVDTPPPDNPDEKTEEEALKKAVETPGKGKLPIRVEIRGMRATEEINGLPIFRKGGIRASIHYYNTKEEIDEFVRRLSKLPKRVESKS